jgi:predicted acylesterase/phospholipase RssA
MEDHAQFGKRELTLCLSGGGLRATYFHLGVIWALRATGELHDVKRIFAVSGGSILAAHLALNWESYSRADARKAKDASADLLSLADYDVRGSVVRRAILATMFLVPLLNVFLRLLGRPLRTTRTELLAAQYRRIFKAAPVARLKVPDGPDVSILCTSLLTGELSSFSSAGFKRGTQTFGGVEIQIAAAVAASSAFPPLFPPVPLHRTKIGATRKEMGGYDEELLTDGGVFDNLGYYSLQGEHSNVILSDAGAQFDIPTARWFWSIISRTARATDILMKRVGDEAIKSASTRPGVRHIQIGTYKADQQNHIVKETAATVARIRTDLDIFNVRETSALVLHGYDAALTALNAHPPEPDWSFLPVTKIANEDILSSSKRRVGLFKANDPVAYALWIWVSIVTSGMLALPAYLQARAADAQRLAAQQQQQAAQATRAASEATAAYLQLSEEVARLNAALGVQTCTPGRLIRSITIPGNIPTRDGEGNTVGSLSDMSASILETCNSSSQRSTKFVFSYGYYNGSGTWRGSQTVTLTFKAENGATIGVDQFPLDRGRCIYGGPERRVREGPLPGGEAVTNVEVTVSRVTGAQTRC